MTIRDALASALRTYVPVGVSFVLTLLARKYGFIIDDSLSTTLTFGVAGLVVAVYYGALRLLEQKFPWVGVLLGWKAQPSYPETTTSGKV